MVQLQEMIGSVLKSREFGVYPPLIWDQQDQRRISDELLTKALDIEYRTTAAADIAGLINESEQLFSKTDDSTAQLTLNVALGHLYYLSGQNERAIELLSSIKLVENDTYLRALYYRAYWIIASSYIELGQMDQGIKTVVTGVNLFKFIPLVSEVECNYWLLKLFDLVKGYVLPVANSVGEVQNVFKHKNFVVYYVNYTNTASVNGFETFIKTRAGELLSSVKFPKSNQENNYELEEFLEILIDCNLPLTTLMELVEQGISKTYQSQKILKSYIKVLFKSKENRSVELESSLDVYITYVENYYELNNKRYYDILAVLDLFEILMANGPQLQKFQGFLTKFQTIVLEFYSINGVNHLHKSSDVMHFKNPELRLKFSKYWHSIAINTFALHKSSRLIEDSTALENSLEEAFENCIILNPNNAEFKLDYILSLSTLRKVKVAYKLLKDSLVQLTPGTVMYFRSLHLLSLILSIEDNKDEAYKISSFLDTEVEKYLSTITPTSLDLKFKEKLVEFKITHLAIIESFYGINQALDSLDALFVLFNKLFSDIIIHSGVEEEEEEEERKEEEEVRHPVKSHRKSLSLAKQQTLTKIKSIKHKKHQKAIKTATETFKIPKDHITECKLLQKLWLVSSQIYFKMSLYKESEESLVEAENSYRSTDETCFQLSCLLIEGSRYKLAFEEFERGLNANKLSVGCIVGLSNLVLNHSTEPQDSDPIFINEKDRLAALARVKLLLEETSKTFKGYYTSEVWLLLSQIYEKFGDSKRLQKSLWRSIQLEESRPVRDFSCA